MVIWAYFNYAFIPAAKTGAKIEQANQAASAGRFRQAHNLLAAAEDDCLSSAAPALNGRLYLQRSLSPAPGQAGLLLLAEKNLLVAIERNQADFKNFERLTEVYTRLAEISSPQESRDWLNKAFDTGFSAVQRYPGSGRLQFKLAQIAEKSDRTDTAIERYRRAVEIEDSFRRQFRLMYPGRQVFSRLGEERYQLAKRRIENKNNQSLLVR